MAPRPSEKFKRDAVRIALTSGLTRRQATSDLGLVCILAGQKHSNNRVDKYRSFNAALKTFIKTIKAELIWRRS